MWPQHSDKQTWRDVARKNITSPHMTKPQSKTMYLHEIGFLLQLCAGKHDITTPHVNLANSPSNSADSLWQINKTN